MRGWGRRLYRWCHVVATLAVILLPVGVTACRTAGDAVLPEGERPLVVDGPRGEIRDDDLRVRIDLGNFDTSLITSVVVEAYHRDALVLTADVYPTVETDGRVAVELPVRGLEDRETYAFRLFLVMEDGNRYPVEPELQVRFNLGLPVPDVGEEPVRTFEPRHSLAWSLPGDEVQGDVAHALVVLEGFPDGSVLYSTDVPINVLSVIPDSDVVSATDIASGRQSTWRVRTASSRGLLGPWSRRGTLVFTEDLPQPEPLTGYGNMASVVALPGLVWREIPGAILYDVEIVSAVAAAETTPAGVTGVLRRQVTENRYRIDTDDLERLIEEFVAAGSSSASVMWRLSAENRLGNRTEPSQWFSFRYDHRMGTMETIVPAGYGTGASLPVVVMGSEQSAEQDESPPLPVTIDRSFAMSRYEITTEVVAGAYNSALRRGRLEITKDDEGNRFIADARSGYRLIALDDLDFGTQFSLRLTSTGRLEPVPGYSTQPAVGISWYGAVFLANELSLLEGRDEVYEISPDGVKAHFDRDGYRLPSEAEWALAAALERRIPPTPGAEQSEDSSDPGEPELRVRENRPVGAIELRGSNYQRSGHRWEDLSPPYTRAGGPTTPVGALGYANPAGLVDMLGNVWEWTADWYDPDWYTIAGPVPVMDGGPAEAVPDMYGRVLRVVRGGAWNTPRDGLRRTNRGAFSPESTSHSIGVRLVRTLQPDAPMDGE